METLPFLQIKMVISSRLSFYLMLWDDCIKRWTKTYESQLLQQLLLAPYWGPVCSQVRKATCRFLCAAMCSLASGMASARVLTWCHRRYQCFQYLYGCIGCVCVHVLTSCACGHFPPDSTLLIVLGDLNPPAASSNLLAFFLFCIPSPWNLTAALLHL